MRFGLAVITAAALLVGGMGPVEAQRPRNAEPPQPMYRIPGSAPEPERFNRQSEMTERTYNTLSSIHQDIGDENYPSAIERLIALQSRGRLNDYERALLMQNLGTIYAITGRTDLAKQQLTQALALDALEHGMTQDMIRTLGQLYAIDEEWNQAIRMMTRYFYWEDDPSADDLILMANSYALNNDFRNGLVWVQRAIQHSREPRENWYMLWLAMNNELRDYQAAADVLMRMIGFWPGNVRYWEYLAGMMMELNREADALAVLSVAYQRGLLIDERKIMNLVQMYRYRSVPYSAARILQTGIDNGVIERTEEHWELLSQSYQAAEELDDAIRALQQAAALSDDGELYVREAQLHATTDDWAGVRVAIRNALDKGGLRNPGRAYMMLGIAAFEDRQMQQALDAFRGAAQHADSRTRATQWINYVNNYIRTQRALREGL